MSFFNSIKARIISITLLIVVVSISILGIVAVKISSSAINLSVENTLTSISSDIENQINALNVTEFTMIRALSQLPITRDENVSMEEKCALYRPIPASDRSKYENVSFYDLEARSISYAGDLVQVSKDRPYFSEGIKGNEYVADPLYSSVVDGYLMFYTMPCYSQDNRLIGMIISNIKGNRLSNVVSEINLPGGEHPFIVNRKTGVIVGEANAEPIDLEVNVALKNVVDIAKDGVTAIGEYKDSITNKKMIYCCKPVRNCDWAIVSCLSYDYYYGKLQHLFTTMFILILVTLIVLSVVIITMISKSLDPLTKLKSNISEIATGNADLTKRIRIETNNEVGDVVKAFNTFTAKLQNIIQDIQKTKNSLAYVGSDLSTTSIDTSRSISEVLSNIEGVYQQIKTQGVIVEETANALVNISSKISSLTNMIHNQSSGVTQASSAVEEMIGSIASVNKSVDKMANSFSILYENVETGSKKQEIVTERIQKIEEQSKMLQEANIVISNIANQTNLLAMNAAIEAAHAGNAGKGFSVVADEIRKLSETSTQQSKQIGTQLSEIMGSINGVVVASSESSETFTKVSTLIKDTDQVVRQIKGAMDEQNQGSKQISQALVLMNNSTTDVRVASQEMSNENEIVRTKMSHLQDSTNAMNVSMTEMSTSAKKINESEAMLQDIANKVKTSIDDISEQIDLFKVN